MRRKKLDIFRLICYMTGGLLLLNVILLSGFVSYRNRIRRNKADSSSQTTFDRHFTMIVDNSSNGEFWDSVYEGALQMGNENGAFVERMGENLTEVYSSTELMKIAIAESVDGIMLEYTGDPEMEELIGKAVDKGIPVVTMLRDATGSKRTSYVDVSYFNLGQQYAEQIAAILAEQEEQKETRVFLLASADIAESARTVVYSAIQDTLASEDRTGGSVIMDLRLVDESSPFEAEESIRDIFMDTENLPDIIVCLDEITGACVYQALIDYNQVGNVEEIAYYSGASILKGIKKKIVHSTTTVDTKSIGKYAVEALVEYGQSGYASDYYSVDTYVIDRSNIDEYMGGEADE